VSENTPLTRHTGKNQADGVHEVRRTCPRRREVLIVIATTKICFAHAFTAGDGYVTACVEGFLLNRCA